MLARKALLMKTEHSSVGLQRRPCSIEAEARHCGNFSSRREQDGNLLGCTMITVSGMTEAGTILGAAPLSAASP